MAAFLFVQGNAGMIATGSWDSMSLFKQAKFDVGIIDFQLPAKGEPWGEYISGKSNEAGTSGAASYGVYKYSKNRETAVDFLRFLTSQKYNELFNRKTEWIPVVLGAYPSERMMPFMPDPRGFRSAINFSYGSYVGAVLAGQRDKYLGGESDDYEAFASEVEAALSDEVSGGDKAWAISYDGTKRWCRAQERVLTVQSVRALMEPNATGAAAKYRQAFLQQLRMNNGESLRHLFEQVRKKEIKKI